MKAEMPHSEISSNYLNFKKKHTTNHNRKTKKFLYIFPEWQYYLYFVQKQKPKKNDLWEFWQYFITYLLVIHDDFAMHLFALIHYYRFRFFNQSNLFSIFRWLIFDEKIAQINQLSKCWNYVLMCEICISSKKYAGKNFHIFFNSIKLEMLFNSINAF